LATAVVALVASSAAGATIVVQRGMAGVVLGNTQATVRARLGPPPRVRRGQSEFGPYTEFVYPRVTVLFHGNARVTGLRTTSRLERTGRGVGVGSTEAQVRARVPGVRCATDVGVRHCFLGRFLPGRRVTDFRLRRGRVTSVVIGYVLD
jgi:hypothetical protein